MFRTTSVLLTVATLNFGANFAAAQYLPGRDYPNPGRQYYPQQQYGPGPANPGYGAPGWPGAGDPFSGQQAGGRVPVYQLRNLASGEFLYTNDGHEVDTLVRSGTHEQQGAAFSVLPQPAPGTRPLVRYVRGNGTHFLATSRQPARPEVTLGYVFTRPQPGTVPLITWHSPQLSHDFYTTDPRNGQLAGWGFQRADALGYVLP